MLGNDGWTETYHKACVQVKDYDKDFTETMIRLVQHDMAWYDIR